MLTLFLIFLAFSVLVLVCSVISGKAADKIQNDITRKYGE